MKHFFFSRIASGFPVYLQIFWRFHLKQLIVHLISLLILETQNIQEFWVDGEHWSSSQTLFKFKVEYPSIFGKWEFETFLVEDLSRNMQLILVLLLASCLVCLFFYNTIVNVLLKLFVELLFMFKTWMYEFDPTVPVVWERKCLVELSDAKDQLFLLD